ncbi:MAG: CPBP family intramembrane metalloprotease [Calditrichaeota bacterium]|nr:CPBP family intramembrane metalloprotease [Calditrichota bacterium]MCB0285883.1 CPBP family intramembrane metalloprotease [Calditrichota bacterium]MCB0299369.1 CPBP family intramembrane metalloprotease [Calditrichota bacterium]MCB9067791.1 CPBP family intramembrane metalloprotease [Calditrichia bacterium]
METPEPKLPDTNTESNFPLPFESLVVIIMSVLVSYFPLVIVLGATMDPETAEPDMTLVKVLLAVGEMVLLALPVFYLLRRKLSLPLNLRLNPVPGNIVWLSVPVSLCMIVLIDEVDRLVRLVLPLPEEIASEIGKTMLIDNGLDFILVTFSAVILAAVAEEAIFRGMLQQSVEKHVDVTKGVIYSSIAWALVHGNHYMMLQIFLFGFFLGWLAWRTNSIIPTLIAHGLNNAIAILYINFSRDNEPFPIYEWNGHVSPFWLILAIGGLYYGITSIDKFYRSATASLSSDNGSGRS